MQYVKVVGNTHAEAMRKLRDTYGPEAIIYYEKEIPAKTVLSRMVGKKQFMIQAALAEKKNPAKKTSPVLPEKEIPKTLTLEKDMHDGKEFLNLLDQASLLEAGKGAFNLEDISFEKKVHLPDPEKTLKKAGEKPTSKSSTLDDLKQDIEAINKKISILIKNPLEPVPKQQDLEDLDYVLKDQEFSSNWRNSFIEDLKNSMPPGQWKIPEKVFERAIEMMSSRIKVNSRIGSGRVIVLLGATGVGKTTTLAKMASRLKLRENKRVTLVTLDNYRIAATEQLKVYADILDVDIHVTKDPQKFQRILAEDSSDVVLVDTTGVSQHNRDFLLKQKDFFPDHRPDIEKHLVLSATSKPSDSKDILRTFDMFGIDRIILTKLDESRQFGNFIEEAEERNKPFSFFTNGQKVPDDYMPADPEFLACKVLDPEHKWLR